jgi:hypothetical protein
MRVRKGKVQYLGQNPFKQWIAVTFEDNTFSVIPTAENLNNGHLRIDEKNYNEEIKISVKFTGHWYRAKIVH